MTKQFIKEIDRLKERIIALGQIVESQVKAAVDAVFDQNKELAEEVIRGDQEIDRLEVDLEEECLKLLALHQPLAGDLRFIVAVLKINNDLERIADLAGNIAKRAERLSELTQMEIPADIRGMSKKAKLMLRKSLLALVELDEELATNVLEADDEVDAMNRDLYIALVEKLKLNAEQAEEDGLLLSVTKHLERIGDLASNIAEDVIYMLSGEIVRHGRHIDSDL